MLGNTGLSKEALYRAMVELALDALLVLEDSVFVDCNSSAEKMFGVSRQQLLASTPLDFSAACQLDGRDSGSAANEFITLAMQGQAQRFEWLSRKADGSQFISEVCISQLDDGDNRDDTRAGSKTRRVILVVRDISERKRIENATRMQSEQLQILLENFPGGVSLLDDNLRIVAWNQALLQMLDLPAELFSADPPLILEVFKANIKRGEYSEFGGQTEQETLAILMAIVQRKEPYLYERTRHDGAIIEVRGAPIAGGGFVTICTDVSAKRSIEKEYKRQSIFLKAVLANMPQGLSVFDEELRLQVWNQGFLDVLNYAPSSIYRGVPFRDLLDIMAQRGEYGTGDMQQQIESRLALAMQFQAHQFERIRPNGHTHLVQGKPIHEDGKIKGFVTTYTDITKQKQVEMALSEANLQLEKNVAEKTTELRHTQDDLIKSEKLAALGSLVAGIAHELNTPIGNSLLTSSTLREKSIAFARLANDGLVRKSDLANFIQDAEQASTLIERGLRSAAELISSFKQVAVDQASSKRRLFQLDKVCADVIATMTSKIRKAGVRIERNIPINIELDSYPGCIDQIICNLVDNALLHGLHEQVDGRITISALMTEVGMVELSVSDNGAGIAAENLQRIFDPYFTTKLGRGGSGLGLNIVYNIVTGLLGGKISVHSEQGKGVRFNLTLPVNAPAIAPASDST
ncbi:PAS-domain containing protein [Undibacterium sp. Ren11W]|uniref:PAS-domain containing protein n=1 Tax=Undibacterium sp. Ren11W TaxID=3413045 RepID=UPI003BF43E82